MRLRGLSYFAASAAAFASVRAVQSRREGPAEIVWEELPNVVDASLLDLPAPNALHPVEGPVTEADDASLPDLGGDEEPAEFQFEEDAPARVPVLRLLRRLLIVVLGIILIGLLGMWVLTPAGRKASLFSSAEPSAPVEVALLAGSGARASHPDLASAWEGALRSAGLSYRWVQASDVVGVPAAALAQRHPLMIVPDALADTISAPLASRVNQFVRAGGQLVVVSDAGRLPEITGIRTNGRGQGTRAAKVTFASLASAKWWGISSKNLSTTGDLSGPGQRATRYKIGPARGVGTGLTVIAADHGTPIISLNHLGRGTGIFINLPLGRLAVQRDDLPLRTTLSAVTSRFAQLPRLVPTPRGVGGLVIDTRPISAERRREMVAARRSPLQLRNWLASTARYAAASRTIQRVPGRIADLDVSNGRQRGALRGALASFRGDAKRLAARGDLTLRPMSAYATFLVRFAKTRMSARRDGRQLKVVLDNAEGLREIAFSLPRAMTGGLGPVPAGTRRHVGTDGQDVYVATGDPRHLELHFSLATASKSP